MPQETPLFYPCGMDVFYENALKIQPLCASLHPRNPIRRAAQRILERSVQPAIVLPLFFRTLRKGRIKPLLSGEIGAWLLSRSYRAPEHSEREIAIHSLEMLVTEPDAQRAFTELLHTTLETRLRSPRFALTLLLRGIGRAFAKGFFVGGGLAAIGLALYLLILLSNSALVPEWEIVTNAWEFVYRFGLTFGILAAPFCTLKTFREEARNRSELRAAAAQVLGRQASAGNVDVLTAALWDSHWNVQSAVVRALGKTLPHLTPEHYGRLNSQTIPHLCKGMTRQYRHPVSVGFIATILKALMQVGDSRAIPYVERMAERTDVPEICLLARQTLPILEERQRQEQDRGTLLRGSSMQEAPFAETLLRPLPSLLPETAPEQLLRALNGSDGKN